MNNRVLTNQQGEELLKVLKSRFENNTHRHKGLDWATVMSKLKAKPEKLWSLHQMEKTGGEPDVVIFADSSSTATINEITFCDCSTESPKGRRSVCYDRKGLESRKEHKPKNNAIDMTSDMGIQLLSDIQYRALQELESFDLKTSSWLKTPVEIRKLGGAIFGDFRYNHVFIYHNGAQSYYAVRGFRGWLKV